MAKQPDQGWRQYVLNSLAAPAATGFTRATAADYGPSLTFRSDRSPDDPAMLLDGLPLVRFKALRQRALDLHGSIPTHDEVQAVRLEKNQLTNRIAELMKHKGEGGFGLSEDAPQVVSERKRLERVQQELTRLETLKEIRTSKWNVAGQLDRSVSDWVLRGIPGDCVLEPIDDAPLGELLTKVDGGRIDAAVHRYQLRLHELAADLHRVKSAPWPSSVAKTAATVLIDRLADQGQPNLDGAIEHGMDIAFATMTTTSMVHNVDARGAVAYAETTDAVGLMCWLWRDQMISKICAGLDEIADDKAALDQAQREEAEATIRDTMLAVERNECACIWAAEAKGDQIEFRADTTPMAVLGVRLRTQPRAVAPATSVDHAYDIVGRR